MIFKLIFNIFEFYHVFTAYDVNYMNLKVEDGVNKKIRPAGYENVQWIIQISSNQNINLEW